MLLLLLRIHLHITVKIICTIISISSFRISFARVYIFQALIIYPQIYPNYSLFLSPKKTFPSLFSLSIYVFFRAGSYRNRLAGCSPGASRWKPSCCSSASPSTTGSAASSPGARAAAATIRRAKPRPRSRRNPSERRERTVQSTLRNRRPRSRRISCLRTVSYNIFSSFFFFSSYAAYICASFYVRRYNDGVGMNVSQ